MSLHRPQHFHIATKPHEVHSKDCTLSDRSRQPSMQPVISDCCPNEITGSAPVPTCRSRRRSGALWSVSKHRLGYKPVIRGALVFHSGAISCILLTSTTCVDSDIQRRLWEIPSLTHPALSWNTDGTAIALNAEHGIAFFGVVQKKVQVTGRCASGR